MLIPGLVVALCSVVALAGAVVAVVDARRVVVHPVTDGPAEVRARLVAELDVTPVLAWSGLAALVVLGGAVVGEKSVDAAEVALVVLLLGLAADRACYLARSRTAGDARTAWTAAISVAVVVAGLATGLAL